MKNNTKIRLHLSKQLFESLTKQVIAEGKNKHYGAGMEEVKVPKHGKGKTPKNEASAMPGVEKAPGLNLSKNDTPNKVFSKQDLKIKFQELIRQINQIKGFDQAESSAIANLVDDIISKLQKGSVANQINMARKSFANSTRNVKEMETMTAEEDTMKEGGLSVGAGSEGAKKAAEELMGMISSGDPFATGVALVLAVVAGVVTADKVVPKLKGYYKALTQKDSEGMNEGDKETKADVLADLAQEAGIDL